MKIAGALVLLIAGSATAQNDDMAPATYPVLPNHVRAIAELVPSGWRAVTVKGGDLNGDTRPDVAILMRMTDPANIKKVTSSSYYEQDDTNPYMLAIGLAGPDGYKLAATNHDLFPRETAPMHGDTPPDAGTVTIARGILSLSFDHLRGFDRFRFRWNGKAFALIGWDCGGVAGGSIFGVSANYLTRKARIERGEVGKDKSHVWTVRIRHDKRPILDQTDWEYGWTGKDTDGNDLLC